MTLKIIKKITSEGKRRVINMPTKHYDKLTIGKKMLIQEVDYSTMTKEELQEIMNND